VALLVGLLALGASARAAGEGEEQGLARCAALLEPEERLACYDELGAARPAPPPRSFIERSWDLYDEVKPFRPWPHRPVYVLPARWSNDPNEEPFRVLANGDLATPLDVQSVEVKFQASFKTKLLDDLLGGPGDLWFGYTQQSHFQFYNTDASRPFRETNYEPELALAFPLRRRGAGWTWRMIGAGVVHQPNGRSEPLSRSWNRLYGMAAIERGPLSILLRPWVRVDSTDPDDDDNPGIEDFVGRFEASLLWQVERQVLTLRGRTNLDLDGHHGSLEVDWYFPLGSVVRGQLQVFHGYGESLIDYNHSQTTLGVGLVLFDPF